MIETGTASARRARAEAVAWLARIQGADRSRELEAGFQEWLARTPMNAAAFEKATDLWEELGGVSTSAVLKRRPSVRDLPPPEPRRSGILGIAAASAATLIIALGMFVLLPESYSTRVGEHRTVSLPDGSRVALNTDSRIAIGTWRGTRQVLLDHGEAFFEVAKDPRKPFVVLAGEKQVVAVGTSFSVRRESTAEDDRVSVILVEGKVAVTSRDVPAVTVLADARNARTLQPGDRLVAAGTVPSAVIDRPRVDAITAWRRGEVILDNTPLKEAVEELNRYSPTHLALGPGVAGELPVSGLFRTGDNESFASAVSSLYGFAVVRESERIVLFHSPPR